MKTPLRYLAATLIYLTALSVVAVPSVQANTGPIVNDIGPLQQKVAVESTISAASDVAAAGSLFSITNKELILDGIAYQFARAAIQTMVRDIVSWINSGFQGRPAFVTDLNGFMLGVADQVAGDVIYGSDLAFLCSPFQLDVRIALATQYNQRLQDYQPQCTLSQVSNNIEGFIQGSFEEGGWPAWFELTQGSTNDPLKAAFEAELAIDAKIRDAQGRTLKELDFGDGFLSFKVCSDTQAASGAQKNCTITTPGTVIATRLNEALGAGQQSLITADEINEIIGALLSQLAQQALGGLLTLGGNSGSTNYAYGASGNSSFLDALEAERTSLDTSFGNTISDQLDTERDYLAIQQEINRRIDDARAWYDSQRTSATALGCSLPSFPNELTDLNNDAEAAIAEKSLLITVLSELNRRYQAATSADVQNDIITEFNNLRLNGALTSIIAVTEADLTREFVVIVAIDEMEDDVRDRLSSCRSLSDDD